MIRRFYVHNFRCLENFELPVKNQASVLLVGKNGSGKTSIAMALEVLQKISRGTNRVGDLVRPKDFSMGRVEVPMRFDIEVELGEKLYRYVIAFEFPPNFKELRVLDESLSVDNHSVYTRHSAQVALARTNQDLEAKFMIDWHLVALPIVQEQSKEDPLFIFKQWLQRMLILRPVPSLITGDSQDETLQPNSQVTNFGAWFSGLMAEMPSSYSKIDSYLKLVMPDLKDIKNPVVGSESRSLFVEFLQGRRTVKIPFLDLSDGEKCFMIAALVLAANQAYGPVLCFWDEPDNHLALQEVGDFVLTLRKTFEESSQLIVTSHNPEAIRRFSDENTFVLQRGTHLEPTTIRPLTEVQVGGDLVGAMIRGDLE